jgi:hypothetical protein
LMRRRRKARKAAARLDRDASTWLDVQRPKGMWRSTFERLRRKASDLEMDAEELFERRYAELTQREVRR